MFIVIMSICLLFLFMAGVIAEKYNILEPKGRRKYRKMPVFVGPFYNKAIL